MNGLGERRAFCKQIRKQQPGAAYFSHTILFNAETEMSSYWWQFLSWLHQTAVADSENIFGKMTTIHDNLRCSQWRYYVKITVVRFSEPDNHLWLFQNGDDRLGVSTLRPMQNGCDLADDIFERIFMHENCGILIYIWIEFDHRVPINNTPALVYMMVWSQAIIYTNVYLVY